MNQETPHPSTSPPDLDVLDVRGVVELVRMSQNAIYRAVAENKIPHRRIGRSIRFSRAAVLRWLEGERPRIP